MLQGLTTSAVFLVVTVNDRPGAVEQVRDAASAINDLVRAVGFRQFTKQLSCVVGFGSGFWDRIRPAGASATARAAAVRRHLRRGARRAVNPR